MFKLYYHLTKPGIVYGNAIAAIAGFLLASKTHVNFGLGLAMLVGISFIIASACVVNNYMDRGIDAKMKRTQKRELVTGTISSRNAILCAVVLGVIGVASLLLFTNILTLGVALFGYFFYVVVYGIWKRRSVYGTVVGSISGAVPPVVGYVAVSNNLDLGAWLLFLVLVCWQMPHFYAIATYRSREYAAASIPVLPLVMGKRTAKLHIMSYIVAFIVTSSLLTVFGYTGYAYFAVMMFLGLTWLSRGVKGLKAEDDDRWARKMFGFSLLVLMGWCIMLSINAWLF